MSVDKFVTIIGEEQLLKSGKQTSVGALDQGRIVALNASGYLDDSLFYISQGAISPGQSLVIYQESFAGFLNRELSVSFSGNDLIKSFNLFIVKNLLSVDDSIFRRMGDLNLTTIVTVQSGDILVTATNNELFAVNFRVRRLAT
jgi:hypothetical protein